MERSHGFLIAYSGVLTATLSILLLSGTAGNRKTSFEEIDVQRINLREPDGTLRYVLSSAARMPGAIVRGREYEHPRPQAGMLFYNDEGSEAGGLIFDGGRDAQGNVMSGGSLTFDRYEQDQIVQLLGVDRGGGKYSAGLVVNDRPDRSIIYDLEEVPKLKAMSEDERNALMERRYRAGHYGGQRLFVGRGANGDAKLALNDAAGKPRIQIVVASGGEAAIEFLDEQGQVAQRLAPESLAK